MESVRKSSNVFDYEAILSQCRIHWWWFVISILFCSAVGLLYAYRKSPLFVVEANIMVRPEKSSLGSIASSFDLGLGNLQSQEVDDELAFISSYSVMNQVVKDMQLNISYYVKKNLLKTVEKPLSSPLKLGVDPALADTLSTSLLFKVKMGKGASDIEIVAKELTYNKVMAEVKANSLPTTVKTPYGLFIIDKTSDYNPKKSLKEVIVLSPYTATTRPAPKSKTPKVSVKKSVQPVVPTPPVVKVAPAAPIEKPKQVAPVKRKLSLEEQHEQKTLELRNHLEHAYPQLGITDIVADLYRKEKYGSIFTLFKTLQKEYYAKQSSLDVSTFRIYWENAHHYVNVFIRGKRRVSTGSVVGYRKRSFKSHVATSGVWSRMALYGGTNGRIIRINAGHGRR